MHGIDYARFDSTANRNTETGVRYGVIALSSLADWAFDEFFYRGRDLTYEAALADARESGEYLDDDGEFDEQAFADDYMGDESEYELEADGMKLLYSPFSGGIVYVMESPVRCETAFCSPCIPGAGDLDHPSRERSETGDCYDIIDDWRDSEATR